MSFKIGRGTNISHWLSQSDARGRKRKDYFKRDDVFQLASLGLDHLRIPIDEEQMWDEAGNREPDAWELLNNALDWCREAGLKAIIDLHILRSHCFCDEDGHNTLFTDEKEARHLGDLWRDLSSEFKDRSTDWVAYELMNEAVADDPEDWNRVLRIPYDAIRETEPDRTIAIGSNEWCQVQMFPYLKVPEQDPNLILVVHFYFPMLITHYKADWWAEARDYAGPIQYPGRPIPEAHWDAMPAEEQERFQALNKHYDCDVMIEALQPAVEVAKAYNLPLWCNEYGVVEWVDPEIRKAWYLDFVKAMDACGIVWTNWDYRGLFGLYDSRNRSETIVAQTLFPKDRRPESHSGVRTKDAL